METSSPTVERLTPEQRAEAREAYKREGFFLAPKILPDDLLIRVSERMDAIVRGEYETGVPPAGRSSQPGERLDQLQKIDNAHLSDRVINEAISYPAIGQWAAALTGAKMVQVFATQLLVKPSGTEEFSNVGWHQDLEYWSPHLKGELFTAWLAISDVTEDAGPMRFVQGSQQWGLLQAGNFFSGEMEELKERFQQKRGSDSWNEVPGILPAGAVSFHHCLTVHGSGSNTLTLPRKSFAIHLRTEKSGLVEGTKYQDAGWLNDWNDEFASPIIYREG